MAAQSKIGLRFSILIDQAPYNCVGTIDNGGMCNDFLLTVPPDLDQTIDFSSVLESKGGTDQLLIA